MQTQYIYLLQAQIISGISRIKAHDFSSGLALALILCIGVFQPGCDHSAAENPHHKKAATTSGSHPNAFYAQTNAGSDVAANALQSAAPVNFAAGIHVLARSARISGDRCLDMLVASDGHVYLCGFASTEDLADQVLIACFDPSGKLLWKHTLGKMHNDRGGILAEGPHEKIYFSATMSGADGPTPNGLAPVEQSGAYVYEIGRNGRMYRAPRGRRFPFERITNLSVGSRGVVMAGTRAMQGSTGTELHTVLAQFDAEGESIWEHDLGSKLTIRDMDLSFFGTLMLVGDMHDTLTFGGQKYGRPDGLDSEAFIMRYFGGTPQWFKHFGSIGNSRPGYRSADAASWVCSAVEDLYFISGCLEGPFVLKGETVIAAGVIQPFVQVLGKDGTERDFWVLPYEQKRGAINLIEQLPDSSLHMALSSVINPLDQSVQAMVVSLDSKGSVIRTLAAEAGQPMAWRSISRYGTQLLLAGTARGGLRLGDYRIAHEDDRHVLHLLSLPLDAN